MVLIDFFLFSKVLFRLFISPDLGNIVQQDQKDFLGIRKLNLPTTVRKHSAILILQQQIEYVVSQLILSPAF